MSHKSGLQTATKTNINLRVKFWLRSPLATIYIYMLWIKTTFISQHVAFFSWLFCDHIFCYVHVLNWDDVHQSLWKKGFKQFYSLPYNSADVHSLLNAARLCSAREIEMKETCKWKCRKAYFVHSMNKLQQVKLSALWMLAMSSTILIYNNY